MTKRIKIIRIGLLSAIVIILITYFAIEVFEFHPSPPFAINNIKSTDLIYFDVAADNDQNINLVWTTRENIPTYQKSTDGGKTWSLYYKFDDLGASMYIRPRIFAVDTAIVLLWVNNGSLFQRMSPDGGVSWSDKKEVMARTRNDALYGGRGLYYKYKIDEMAKTPGQLSSVLISDEIIYIVYGDVNGQGLYFSKSGDYGNTWFEPKRIFSYVEHGYNGIPISLAINNNCIHIIYNLTLSNNSYAAGLYYINSSDLGEHWDNGRILVERSEKDNSGQPGTSPYYIVDPKLIATGDTLYLFYFNRKPQYLISIDNGIAWSMPHELKYKYSEQYSVFTRSLYEKMRDEIVMLKTDDRNRARDWWGYIPFHPILFWMADPCWSNNDLYYALIKGGTVTKMRRLTPQLSYVETYGLVEYNAFKCLPLGENNIIFWAGKRKVGKNFTDQNIPYQIFYKPLKTD